MNIGGIDECPLKSEPGEKKLYENSLIYHFNATRGNSSNGIALSTVLRANHHLCGSAPTRSSGILRCIRVRLRDLDPLLRVPVEENTSAGGLLFVWKKSCEAQRAFRRHAQVLARYRTASGRTALRRDDHVFFQKQSENR